MISNKTEEERLFFSNIMTIFAIVLSLLLVVMSAVVNTNIALNGATKLTHTQITLSNEAKIATVKYFSTLLALLSLASLSRFMSSWKRFQNQLTRNSLKTLSWLCFVIVIGYVIWLIWIYM
jgi:hypothetical protein